MGANSMSASVACSLSLTMPRWHSVIAIAVSAPAGFAFDRAGRFTHIIDPRTGATPARWARVTVTAPTAAEADALSTGFALMQEIPALAGVTVERS